jgi:serine/threonine-protein kinase
MFSDQKEVGPYILLEELAQGATTILYKARAPHFLGQTVVIKLLAEECAHDSECLEAMRVEAGLLSRLSHPNIIKILDYNFKQDTPYSVFEYVQGWNLRSVINQHGKNKMAVREWYSLSVILELCRALHYLHRETDPTGKSMEIVHGDINPKNILMSSEGNLKLIDLGISQSQEHKMGQEDRVGRGSISYMAPEQASRKLMDSRSDLFSAGVILYELLIGEKPFQGKDRFEVEKNLFAKEISASSLPDKISPQLKPIIIKALRKKPDERYQNAVEMEKDLSLYVKLKYPGLVSADLAEYLTSEVFRKG